MSVTDKPITAIVYSHAHADHISGIDVYLENAQKNNISIEIIATDKTARKSAFVESGLPAPTKLSSFLNDSMKFDNTTLSVIGFENGAHTEDSAMWLLEDEGVLHIPDYINPDQLPYLGFALAEQLIYFHSNLELMLEKDWTVMTAGHGNIRRRVQLVSATLYSYSKKGVKHEEKNTGALFCSPVYGDVGPISEGRIANYNSQSFRQEPYFGSWCYW